MFLTCSLLDISSGVEWFYNLVICTGFTLLGLSINIMFYLLFNNNKGIDPISWFLNFADNICFN